MSVILMMLMLMLRSAIARRHARPQCHHLTRKRETEKPREKGEGNAATEDPHRPARVTGNPCDVKKDALRHVFGRNKFRQGTRKILFV